MDSPAPKPSLWLLLRVWLALGCQSFGGGSATLTLIRRAVVERHGWLTEAEFTREWALCQITPGINLMALTILIGRRLAGAAGILVCLLGLLLPSVTLTILITAFYTEVKSLPVVQAALRGMIPASVGLGLATAQHMAKPPLEESRKEGKGSLLLAVFLLSASGLLVALWKTPVVVVLLAAGCVGALFQWQHSRQWKETINP